MNRIRADGIAYCFNPNCPPHPQPLTGLRCRQCGAFLELRGYWAIALLKQNRLSRTLLAIDHATPPAECVIQQSWDTRSKTQAKLPLQALSRLAQIPALLECFEQDGVCYLVQEYIRGDSLAKTIATQGQFSPAEVWQVLELLPVLQQIHAQDVIHGDIKPENIICSGDRADGSPRLVLVDFGAAILSTDRSHRASGSPEYAAPEQIQGEAVFASDLYSLGVVCIHLLTGIPPFQLFDSAANGWIWRNYWLNSGAAIGRDPADRLAQILDRLIAPNLSQRFESASAAIAQIERLWGRKMLIPIVTPPAIWRDIHTFSGHEGLSASVTAVAIAPNRQHIASGSEDKTLRLWDLATGKGVGVLQGHTQFVQSIAFHPHQSVLVSAGRDRLIKLWDWTAQREICSIAAHSQPINSVTFSPDGQWLASGSADKTVKVWSKNGELISTFAAHRLAVNAVAFAPLAPLIASASADATIRIWHLETAKLVYVLKGHVQAVRAIAFSPDGQLLASGGEDRTIRLWDVASGECVRVLPGHSWSVSALVFESNHTLISGSWDKTVKVWQVETGEAIAQLVGHTDSVTSVAIPSRQDESASSNPLNNEPTQRFLISGSRDRTVKQWQLWRC
ncbi:MAG: serine/threonine protein kinase [Phormidesmis sp. CAN_BIN36]|nr:serine/threonine protein kinase [Phormidesmis sp. CAN_BIN36]